MNVIEIIPLASFPYQLPQLLSYYSNKALAKGSVVEVLINRRKVKALVVSSLPVEEAKMLLKKSGFQLKKISSIISEKPLIGEIQFHIALWLSRNYFSSLGSSFKTILPPFFANVKYDFDYPRIATVKEKPQSIFITVSAKSAFNAIDNEIKPFLKKKKQVLIVLPEISLVESYYQFFNTKYRALALHGKISVKKTYDAWRKISSGEAEVVIGTRQALFAPFFGLGLIVMEDPANGAYKSDMTPKYNTRRLAEKIAELYSANLVFVSAAPDLESLYYSSRKVLAIKKVSIQKKPEIKIVDMVEDIKSGNFYTFSRRLKEDIADYLANNKKILIFSTRKGYSTLLMCENCAYSFKCPQCSVPLRIHTIPEPLLVCHRCSQVQKMPDHCPKCNSYKIKSAGFAGSEKIKEELEAFLKSHNLKKDIFMFDADSVKNLKAENTLIDKIKKTESFVCIATQSIFSRRAELSFDLAAIINLDSLTTVPDFRSEENLFLEFIKLTDFNPEKIVVQTFSPEGRPAEMLLSGDYKGFYEKELVARKLFSYPPFARLAKVSFFSANKNKAFDEASILSTKLKSVITRSGLDNKVKLIGPSAAFVEKQKNLYAYNIVVKIPPTVKVEEILKFVPSNWSVDVDPRSVL